MAPCEAFERIGYEGRVLSKRRTTRLLGISRKQRFIMEENIIDLDVNSIYDWCYREKKEMTLNFSIKYQKYSSVFGHLREVKQANDKLLECLGVIHNFCGVCRIFTNNYELVLDYEHDLIVSKMKLEIHSGSMIDEKTLEREIRNIIYYAPFDKYDMIWTLS